MHHLKITAVFSVILIWLGGCATPNTPPVMKVSASSHELATGEILHRQILADFELHPDPALQSYVQTIVLKLSQHAERKLDYKVTVLKDERIYAISAPGGKIYITSSFLTFLKNEAELAAVLGHEIGELQFLDPHFDPLKKTISGATKAGQMIGPFFGQIGALATLGLVTLQAVYLNDPGLGTRIESSDRWAMHAMLNEKYDPQALLNVLEHFAKYDRQALSLFYDYYQSRPITVDRLRAAHEEFGKLKLGELELKTNFEEYRKETSTLQEA